MGDIINRTYKVSPKGTVGGIAIYGADPALQAAYRIFLSEGIGMGEVLAFPVPVPNGLKGLFTLGLITPFSLKLVSFKLISSILSDLADTAKAHGINRAACILRREDVDIPVIRRLVSVPAGKDFVTHVMSQAKRFLQEKLAMEVEVYLAEIKGDEVEFYKLD